MPKSEDAAISFHIKVCTWAFGFGMILSWFKIELQAHAQRLKADLSTFEVRNANAFCCEVNHVLPDGQPIPCDRAFVEASIKSWYDKEDRDGLDEFNDQVRTNLSTHVGFLLGKKASFANGFYRNAYDLNFLA